MYKKLLALIALLCITETRSVEQKKPRVAFSMIMKNEAGRKLRECLQELRYYAQKVDLNVVIIDDGSTDDSIKIAREVLQGIPLTLIENKESKFFNEIVLRKQQWEETLKTNPEWILNIDADQIFEKRMRDEIYNLTAQNTIDVWCFRLYDFWDETHYRDDQLWCAHNTYRSFLLRYRPDFKYEWKETPQHCGHFPKNIYMLPAAACSLRLKHYGWANKEDREAKYKRYQQLDPDARYGSQIHYDSILDQNPHLIEWVENEG